MANKWVENHDTGMCYSLVKDRAYTWTDAKEYCKEMGGHREYGDLASIGTLEEQTFFNCEIFFSIPIEIIFISTSVYPIII